MPQTACRALALAVAVLTALAPRPAAAAPEADLQDRLDAMVRTLDQRREALHVPGLAIAVVKDGEVILAKGLGLADVQSNRPVTPETVFAIGSTTKTFTAAMVGMGVDAGRLSFDDTVAEHVPGFRMPEGVEEATLRDVLCHRTGLTRMPMLWAAGEGTFEATLKAIPNAELYAPFRSRWLYNNVMFSMAGHAAAHAAGATYEELLHRDFFTPLAMERTTTDHAAIAESPEAATGYAWDEEAGAFDPLPPRRLHLVAPAGAINSSVLDMTAWVKTLLARGVAPSGTRLISEESLEACWTPQIDMGDGRSYGLGWMIDTRGGRRVVEHGGNIDGFASTLALAPDHGVGFTMLMNVTASPLQSEAIGLVLDAVLGSPRAEGAGDADPSRFAGDYAFEALGGDMRVELQDGTLVCHIPGQGSTTLGPPDADGKRAFAVNPGITVRFVEEGGRVTAMEFFQGPAHMLLPRRGEDGSLIAPPMPFTPEQLERLAGRYRFEALGVDCTVLAEGGVLKMDVPGQMVYALAWDGDNDRWRFRDHPGITLVFEPAEGDAAAEAIAFTQAGQTTRLPRVGEAPAGDLPDLDALLATRRDGLGADALADARTMKMTATLRVVHQGVTATVTTYARGRDHYATTVDTGGFGVIRAGCTPAGAWSVSPGSPLDEVSGGAFFEQARLEHPWLVADDLSVWFEDLRVEAVEERDGARVAVITAEPEHTPPLRLHLDAQTGRTLKIQSQTIAKGLGAFPVTATFDDWRSVGGLWFPFRTESENPATGRAVITVDSMEFDVEIPEGVFEAPRQAAGAGAR